MKGFRYINHTADIQSQSWGRTLEEAFSQCALSLMTIITPNLEKISPQIEKSVKIKAEDKEALLFDFLSEFLYIFDVEGLIFKEINVEYIEKINKHYKLEATMKGEKFNKKKHDIGTEVKAITYSFINIDESEDDVKINIVFDI
ncbi:MAG: archease [Candidatus Thorarchaeota archaeon]